MSAIGERYSARLRAMYSGERAYRTARILSQLWARVLPLGLAPPRWVTLEVVGRKSGRPTRFPLGMADVDGRWFLVSMLGENCNWVRNVRAADGRAVLRRRGAKPCLLVEVPVDQRVPIIRRYLEKVPGGRPHIDVTADAPDEAIAAIAARHPVFEVRPRP
jgi:deazaflavin-dependent oxidoreductase (nitroreductase family)